ncbi:MAG: SDR family NAD(P)-dependent oxidoreductase, partial [Spirochaetota bacterium]
MKDRLFWQGKNIVITGASSGIGKAILLLLKDIDCNIYTLNRQTLPLTFPHTAKITQISCDISQEEQIQAAVASIQKDFKILDVLFNNAGITAHGRFDRMDFSVFHSTFAINFFGTVYLTKLLIEEIKAAQGTIITTSTVSGLYGIPGRSVYS